MRFLTDGLGLRYFSGHAESAYLYLKWSPLHFVIETPSDWHEHRRAWLHVGLFLFRFAISVPWPFRVPADDGQCSGPRYGFKFHSDILWIYYGKDHGNWRKDHHLTIYMPWAWKHLRTDWLEPNGKVHSRQEPGKYDAPSDIWETHPYTYLRRNREIQQRTARIYGKRMEWRLKWATWLPWPRMVRRTISITFNDEVGEKSGSWKGGTIGCSWEWRKGETMLQALRRMERERVL